jgi:hypothetical protein
LTTKPSKVLIIRDMNCHSGGSTATEESQGGEEMKSPFHSETLHFVQGDNNSKESHLDL